MGAKITRQALLGGLAALAVAGVGAGAAWAAGVPAYLTAALADSARPEADTKRDEARKPAEMLAFAGVKPGQTVVDFMMGSGYFTRILASAVGPTGKVYAYQCAEFIKFRAAYGTEQQAAAAPYKNVTPLTAPLAEAGLPEKVDLVLTVQNYHDLHLKQFAPDTADVVNKQVFKALKPGGVYLVADHAAAAGAPLDVANTLHRIDPAIVRKEVEAAGFKLAAEDDKLLANPADPHTENVFRGIRGHTDQFVMKFVKPK
jgi:predicted methyltransferase